VSVLPTRADPNASAETARTTPCVRASMRARDTPAGLREHPKEEPMGARKGKGRGKRKTRGNGKGTGTGKGINSRYATLQYFK
jgi:hypothetical protein